MPRPKREFHPVTPERWHDFERLFGPKGACAGCWCMWWRQSAKQFEAGKGENNRKAMKKIVNSGTVPGIMAYVGGEPAGWCSVAPRSDFPRLETSRILKPVDDAEVWSVVCLFVDKKHRNSGLAVALLKAAVKYVRTEGGRIVEGYAVEPRKKRMPDTFAFHGPASAYLKAGFKEVVRRSETRPIMRRMIRGKRK